MSRARGLTLMEVIVAAAIGLVILGAVFLMDVSRARMHQELRVRSGVLTERAGAARSGVVQLAKYLEQADRIVLPGPERIQFRIYIGGTAIGPCPLCPDVVPPAPPAPIAPCCFDLAGNYRWDQAARVGTNLVLWRNIQGGCAAPRILAMQITGATFQFARDVAPPPPGGESSVNDLNLLDYLITWNDTQNRSQVFAGQVTSRAIPYSNLGGTTTDSGRGLAAPGVDDLPPASCS